VAVTLAVRRLGPRVGGVLGGLPLVAGPILLVFALDHGDRFAARAAGNTLVALIALAGFVLAVAWIALRAQALLAMVAGWAVFLGLAALVAAPSIPPLPGLGLTLVAIFLALRILPHPAPGDHAGAVSRPRYDLLVRALVSVVMVVVITSLSARLGPAASGVLAPFPILTSVLAGFSIAHDPRATTLQLLRGMLRGFFAFAAFCFVLAVTLEPWGTALAFTAAIAATAAVQATLIIVTPDSDVPTGLPSPAMPGSDAGLVAVPVTERSD